MTALNLDMNSNDLNTWIAANGPVHVVFSEGAENLECYPEEGIQAIITEVKEDQHDCHKWMLDFTPFELVNTLHEKSTYYGVAPGSPGYLGAYATNFYKRVREIYIMPEDKLSAVLMSIAPAAGLDVSADAVEQRFATLEKALGDFSI